MLSRVTTFVTGAGASFELGLPLGSELKDQIRKLLNIKFEDGWRQSSGDYQIMEHLRRKAQSEQRSADELLQKCRLIRNALPASLSIDNLLDAHRSDPDVALIGKLAVAKSILAAERGSKLFIKEDQSRSDLAHLSDTYLIPLFQIISEGVRLEDVNSILDKCSFVFFSMIDVSRFFFSKQLLFIMACQRHELSISYRRLLYIIHMGKLAQ